MKPCPFGNLRRAAATLATLAISTLATSTLAISTLAIPTLAIPTLATPAHAETTVQIENGNVTATINGAVSQITTDGQALEATASRDGSLIAYIRRGADTPNGKLNSISLCVAARQACQTIVAGTPANAPEDNLTGIVDLHFSYQAGTARSGRLTGSLFFLTNAWSTSGAVHRTTLTPPPVTTFVTDSNSLDIVPGGRFAGALLIAQYRDGPPPEYGSCDQPAIFDPNTKKILQLLPSPDCDALHLP